jgi:hypothetical protein
MRNFRVVYLLWILPFLASCRNELITDAPFRVYVSGQILNYTKGENKLSFGVNRLGQDQIIYYPVIEEDGSFTIEIDIQRKTDFWISFKNNILLPIFKSDSIYIVFDGSVAQRNDFYNSIVINGNDVEYLNDALAFQKLMNSNTVEYVNMTDKMKELDEAEFKRFMDSIMVNLYSAYKGLVFSAKSDREIRTWTKFELESYFYYCMSEFPSYHRDYSVCGSKGYMQGFYNFQLKRLPLNQEYLNNAGSVNTFANRYSSGYLIEKFDSLSPESYSREYWDSIWIATIIKYTPDVFLRQLVLVEHFNQYIEAEELDIYEMYKDSLLHYVTDSCLLNPLLKNFEKKRFDLNNKKNYSHSVLEKIKGSK